MTVTVKVAIKILLGRLDFSVDPVLLHLSLLAEGFVEIPIMALHLIRVAAPRGFTAIPSIACWWRRR